MGGMHPCLKCLCLLTALCACSAFGSAHPHNRRLANYEQGVVRTCQELWDQLNSLPLPEVVQVEGLVRCNGEGWGGRVNVSSSVVIRGMRGASGPAVLDFGDLTEGIVLSSGAVVGFQDVVVVLANWELGSADVGVFGNEAGSMVGLKLSRAVFWARACGGVVGDSTGPAGNLDASDGQLAAWEPVAPSNTHLLQWAAVSSQVAYRDDLDSEGGMELYLCGTLVVCDPEPTPPKLDVVGEFLESPEAGSCLRELSHSNKKIRLATIELVIVAVLGSVLAIVLALLFVAMWCMRTRGEVVKGVPGEASGEARRDGLDYWAVQNAEGSRRVSTEIQYLDENTMYARSLDGAGISDIEVGEPLGRGGFGKVYRGVYRGIVLAVKVIDHDGTSADGSHEPMEALLSKFVNHPNVIRTYLYQTQQGAVQSRSSARTGHTAGTSTHRGESGTMSEFTGENFGNLEGSLGRGRGGSEHAYRTWMIMEFCDQRSLHVAMKEGRFFHDEHKRKPNHKYMILTAMDIASAMSYLHSKRIIHGDLKGGNVLLKSWSADERGFVCKVGDFGLSRVVTSGERLQNFTCGSIRYMPPELLRDGLLTPALDVFSFGILLWEIVSGKRAYPTRCSDEIIVSIVEGKRPAMPSHCPVGLASLIEDCWQHEHAKRPTFGRILERLQQVGNEFGHPMSQGLMRIVEEPEPERQRASNSRAGESSRVLEIVSTGSQDVPTQNLLLGGMLRRATTNSSFWTRRIPFRRSPTSGSDPASSETEGSTHGPPHTLSLQVPPTVHADTLWHKPGNSAGAPGPSSGPQGPGRVTPQNLEATSPDAAGRTMVRRGKSAGMWDASKAPFSAGAMPWRSVPPNYQRNLRLSGFGGSPSTGGLGRPLVVKRAGYGAEARRARSANGGGPPIRPARAKSGGGVRHASSDLELTSRARAVSEITPASQSTSEGEGPRVVEESPGTSGSPGKVVGDDRGSPTTSEGSWTFQSVHSYPSDDERVGVFVASIRPGDTEWSSSPGPPSQMSHDRTESKINWRSDLSTYYFTPNSTAEREAILEAMGEARGNGGAERRPSWSSGPSGMGGGTGASETESKFSLDISRSDVEDSLFETPTDFVKLDLAAVEAREGGDASPAAR